MTDNILFHYFKHHLTYIKAWMQNNSSLNPGAITAIKTLGNSQLDMYSGQLSVNNILEEVSSHLQAGGINDIIEYRQWIDDGFRLCTLSDGAGFTLRFINHEKFAHIHPARHTPHALRIKANALKSMICYMLLTNNNEPINIKLLNEIRQQYLQLSPVAAYSEINEMEKVFRLLQNDGMA